MIKTSAIFLRKENTFDTRDCVIEKVVRLSSERYDNFAQNMLRDQDFIRDNKEFMMPDALGRLHCLLVVGENRSNGILVDSSGHDYARYSAFIPNVESFLMMEQYPALAKLNQKLMKFVDIAVEHGNTDGRSVVDLHLADEMFNIDLMTNGNLRRVFLDMINERPEVKDWELDKNQLIIHKDSTPAKSVEKPSVLEQIKTSRNTPHKAKDKSSQNHER